MITELLEGMAWQLHGAGIARWSRDVAYEDLPGFDLASDWGVTMRSVPETPSRLVVLSAYAPFDDDVGESTVGVQVRFRGDGDPRSVQRKSDDVFALWQDLGGVEIGGVPVALLNRTSGTSLGQDDNQRYEYSDNYRVRFDRSSIRTV